MHKKMTFFRLNMSSLLTLLVEMKPSRRRLISFAPDRVSPKMTTNLEGNLGREKNLSILVALVL